MQQQQQQQRAGGGGNRVSNGQSYQSVPPCIPLARTQQKDTHLDAEVTEKLSIEDPQKLFHLIENSTSVWSMTSTNRIDARDAILAELASEKRRMNKFKQDMLKSNRIGEMQSTIEDIQSNLELCKDSVQIHLPKQLVSLSLHMKQTEQKFEALGTSLTNVIKSSVASVLTQMQSAQETELAQENAELERKNRALAKQIEDLTETVRCQSNNQSLLSQLINRIETSQAARQAHQDAQHALLVGALGQLSETNNSIQQFLQRFMVTVPASPAPTPTSPILPPAPAPVPTEEIHSFPNSSSPPPTSPNPVVASIPTMTEEIPTTSTQITSTPPSSPDLKPIEDVPPQPLSPLFSYSPVAKEKTKAQEEDDNWDVISSGSGSGSPSASGAARVDKNK